MSKTQLECQSILAQGREKQEIFHRAYPGQAPKGMVGQGRKQCFVISAELFLLKNFLCILEPSYIEKPGALSPTGVPGTRFPCSCSDSAKNSDHRPFGDRFVTKLCLLLAIKRSKPAESGGIVLVEIVGKRAGIAPHS
jgi:hypothetical protein